MTGKGRIPVGMNTVGVAALFLTGFLLVLVFGARSYRSAVDGYDRNMDARALLAYLAACVRSNDTAGALSVRGEENDPILVVADGDTGYAWRIYRRDGRLVEDFARTDAELRPEEGTVLGAAERFEIRPLPGGVLAVTTDGGRVLLHPRSGEGQP